MVVTDDDDVANRIRLLRSHGMTSLTWDRRKGHAHSYDVVEYGFNYRLDEIRAAIGLVQLERLEGENAKRARIAETYRSRLHGTKGIVVPFGSTDEDTTSAHHLAVIVLPADADRAALRHALEQRGIQTSVHYPPIHTFSRYEATSRRALPKTDEVAPRLLTLPLYGHLPDDAVETVAEAVLAGL
jgi:dTDP-4-amino-4,6-dideoxygalactose transaminase